MGKDIIMSITITQIRNAVSMNAANTSIDVEINHPDYGWIPYTLDPADTDMTINNDAVMALIGADFDAYVAPTDAEIAAALAIKVRAKRDELIAATDWTGNSDVTMTSAMTTYRTALRNVPAQAGFPNSITWPTLGGS
jgi:hypothetical protein